MTIYPTQDGHLLSTRRLLMSLVLGVLIVAAGMSDGGRVNVVVLLGLTVVALNGAVLVRRRVSRSAT